MIEVIKEVPVEVIKEVPVAAPTATPEPGGCPRADGYS